MSTSAPAAAPPRFKRSARNYLLDRSFQLKYTGYIVGIALAISLALGGLLWAQTEKTVALGNEAVRVGEQANAAGRDAVAQSNALNKKVEMDALMNYGDQPALLESLKNANKAESDKIEARAQMLASSERALVEQRKAIANQRTTLLATLGSVLALLVILLALAGIVITHKVAGPLFKMKRMIREVGEGRLVVPGRLRKGDELQDFFEVFATMVENLRRRQSTEIELLDASIAQARAGGADGQVLAKLEALRLHMQSDLDRK